MGKDVYGRVIILKTQPKCNPKIRGPRMPLPPAALCGKQKPPGFPLAGESGQRRSTK